MFGRRGVELVKELDQSLDSIPPFNEELITEILEEMQRLYNENRIDVNTRPDDHETYLSIKVRHAVLKRDKRCILAYLYNRLRRIRQMRWEFGSILPPEITVSLSKPEVQWFDSYSKCLATYMKSIGDNHGLNLTSDLAPPKSLFIEVKCIADYGKFEFGDGESVQLKKNTYHLLPRSECEQLVRQGILEHVTT
ncbi:DNA replication complex GINS protein PSF1-like isoform X2 [Cephus cinctus]|uniref:DNA replication complex GINS protein PSF1 n=1 Tax=Cephus cinctus TaxID=211228 RepID=A0AAJ7BX40_CEPCN|nr:DNA replication complex GINS protein PSF1-like isoform X2 [Cephus cinctus]